MLTILAGQDWVKPSGTEVPDFDQRPTSQTFEAETYGRKNPGKGGGDGRDVRAIGAQVAQWPVTVGDEAGAVVADPARSPYTGYGKRRLSPCCETIPRAS